MKTSTIDKEREKTIEFRELVKGDRDDLKKLRELEGDDEASSILYWEAKEAAVAIKGRARPVEVMKYQKDVFLNEPITFPILFSRQVNLKMSRAELMTELSLIVDMSQTNLPSTHHIYSIQVLEPKDTTGFVDLKKLGEYLGGTVPTDLRSGYIYGSFLYEPSPFVRSVILEGVLGNASEIEVSLLNPSTSKLERKRVTLGQVGKDELDNRGTGAAHGW